MVTLAVLAAGLVSVAGAAEEMIEAEPGAREAASGELSVVAVDASELIGKLAYDEDEGVLYVQMANSSDWYGYEGVAADVAEAFMAAESKGTFFNQHVKGKYPVRRWER